MPDNNIAILSLVSKFDEKSARKAAEQANTTYENAMKKLGDTKFADAIVDEFNKALKAIDGKLKGVKLSSYQNDVLESLFSDKTVAEKTQSIENFTKKIFALNKALSGLPVNSFDGLSTKQLDVIIGRQEKIIEKQDEIERKEATVRAKANRTAKTERDYGSIEKKYGNKDYTEMSKSVQSALKGQKDFTKEQLVSIDNFSKILNLYSQMESIQPETGTEEAISYTRDLLTITKELKKARDEVNSFTDNKASAYISKNYSGVNKVDNQSLYTAKTNFVNRELSSLNSQKAKMERELNTYIGETVQKNIEKRVSDTENVINVVEKKTNDLNQRIENLNKNSKNIKNTTDDLSNANQQLNNVGSQNSDDLRLMNQALEEIRDTYKDVTKYAVDAETAFSNLQSLMKTLQKKGGLDESEQKDFLGYATRLDSLKNNEIIPDDSYSFKGDKLEDFESYYDRYLDKYNKLSLRITDMTDDQIDAFNELKKNNVNSISAQTSELKHQEIQAQKTAEAEKELKSVESENHINDNPKNVSLVVESEQALQNIKSVKENLDNLPENKTIKITVENNDYSSTPLLSDEEGKIVTAYRGVKGVWSGLINDKDIAFFTDKIESAADYADSLAESGKVYKANLSFKNPLEVDGNGAVWDKLKINLDGVEQTTDQIVELARTLGKDGVIFKNIKDGFGEDNGGISNVMVALNRAQIKNEEVVAAVKAGSGEMTRIVNSDTTTSTVVGSQNEIQEELKQTEVQADKTAQALGKINDTSLPSSKMSISSGSTTSVIDNQIKKQNEYNDLVAVGYDRIQKMKKISESGTTGQNSVYNLLRLNHEAWDEVKANNFFNTIPEEGLKRYTKILEVVEKIVQEMVQASGLTEDQIVSQLKNIKSAQGGNFKLNGADSGWTHFATYSNGQKDSMQKPNGITYKVYAAFDDIKDLNQNVVASIMDELTKAGFKGRLKTTSGSTSFGDKLNGLAITDQMVVHGSTKKDQEIAYNTLKNMGLKLSYLGGGIDTPDGSFSQTLASGEINKYIQGLEKEATVARDTAKAEQQLADARKESSTASQTPKKDAFQKEDFSAGTNAESQGMEQVEKATEEAVQAKKDFATANEGVQSSINESENPLKLEAELMNQIAESARKAANKKNLFVKANERVKKAAEESNPGLKLESAIMEDIAENTQAATKAKKASSKKETDSTKKVKSSDTSDNDNIILNASPDLYEEYNKRFNPEKLRAFKLELDAINQKIAENDVLIENCKSEIDDLNNGAYDFISSPSFVSSSKDQFEKRLVDLEDENETLLEQAKRVKSALEEEIKLSNEAYSKAKSVINNADNTGIENDQERLVKRTEAYKKLIDTIDQYNNVSKRVISMKAQEGDYNLMYKLRTEIEELSSNPILSDKQVADAKEKVSQVEITLQSLEKIFKSTRENVIKKIEDQIQGFNINGFSTADFDSIYDSRIKTLTSQFEEGSISLNKYNTECNKIFNSFSKVVNSGTKVAGSVKNVNEAVQLMNDNSKSYGTIIDQGVANTNKGITVLTNTVRTSEGEVLKLKYTYVDGMVSMANATKNVRTQLTGIPKFIDAFKSKFKELVVYYAANNFNPQSLARPIMAAARNVIALNSNIVDLAKVSEENVSQLYHRFNEFSDIAKDIGGTISDTISATDDWSKNGYNIPDSEELAKVALIYKNVGDGIDISTANESLISTLKGFNLEAKDAMHIIDVFNEVSNNEPISSAGIGEALQQSAASLNAANTSLEKSVALVTATNSVLQDTSRTGNMWKTVSARLRGADAELKAMGEDTEGMVTSTSKLRDLVMGMTGFDIMKDKDTFKDVYDIVLGIGEKWQDLSDVNRASLLEKLAGVTKLFARIYRNINYRIYLIARVA